ncbi:MAG: helix-hairpin-helix domain-containing protein [Patescibacteria group bacterium]
MPHEGGDPSVSAVWQIYHVPIVLGIFSLLFIVLSITIFIKTYQDVSPIEFRDGNETATGAAELSSETSILVDIQGAIVAPGVYRLSQGARVNDLLTLAGGFLADADTPRINKTLNRAAILSDGAKIYIPFLDEATPADLQKSLMISINTASAAELESLPGVGSVIAEKIIAARPYSSLEELVQKTVMSASLFDKCKERLVL